VQTALTADELRPLAGQIASRGGFKVVHYHRRGYAGSGPALAGASVSDDVADCRALMEALGVVPAHLVGASYSAAIALSLASSSPECVRTLTVLEPPPVHVPSAAQFRATSARLLEVFTHDGPAAALEAFMTMLAGPGWRTESERDLPGSVVAMERDATTFFASDMPALLAWNFGPDDAARIRCPVLYVGGSESGPWFAEVRTQMLQWLPRVEDTTVIGAGHLLACTHPSNVAMLVIDFLRRHESQTPTT
jgi:pimeloyl-ACP methyl ester carboxylesterase